MEPAKCFQDLIVWQKAHAYVLAMYKITENFPMHELFGLTSQLRRASVSIAANIAEGFKKSNSDKVKYLRIESSSADECHYYLLLASDLGYGKMENEIKLLNEVSRMLNVYTKKTQESFKRLGKRKS
jgi:four helix bundle protein